MAQHKAFDTLVATPFFHVHAPVWLFLHLVHCKPAPLIKRLAILISDIIQILGLVVQHTAVQDQILTARNDIQRIELHRFTGADRLSGSLLTLPSTAGPQSLLAEDKSSCSLF